MKDFEAYAVGIVNASVCTTLPDEEAAERLNQGWPTGLDHPWRISSNTKFATGQPHPCPCERAPQTHRHLLFHC